MPDSFGARLRRRREDLGISLVTVAERTKIKQALLESLERDDVSQWPTGFYRRAFIRAYACAIDLEPDAVLREFSTLYPEPPEVDVLVAMASTLERTQGNRSSSGIRTVVGSAIGSLARFRRTSPAEEASAAPADVTAPPPRIERPLAAAPPRASSTSEWREPAAAPVEPEPSAPTPEPVPIAAASTECSLPPEVQPAEPDLEAVAQLCTTLGSARDADELLACLTDVARVLDASGLIVWHWDCSVAHLRPTLVHGYSPRIVSQLPALKPDADNATATAFRTGRPCAVADERNGKRALVVPLIAPEGCGGVLAVEWTGGREPSKSTLAVSTIFAAVLAQLQLAPCDEASDYEHHYAQEGLAR